MVILLLGGAAGNGPWRIPYLRLGHATSSVRNGTDPRGYNQLDWTGSAESDAAASGCGIVEMYRWQKGMMEKHIYLIFFGLIIIYLLGIIYFIY